jgi:hypothetical protein
MVPVDPEARIRELEAELAEARETIATLRGLESENRDLKERVNDLQEELVSLSPPKLPRIDGSPSASSAKSPSQAALRKSRLLTWTTLILVLVGALVAALPYILTQIDRSNRDGGEFTTERGLGPSP